jgi:tetratricopeptide (TPR) repeat protein
MKRWLAIGGPLLGLLLGLTGAAHAAGEAVVGMSEKVFEALNEAQAALDAEDSAAARNILEALLERRKLSAYETAHTLNLLGYCLYEADDLPGAQATYERALALEGLPGSMQAMLLVTLGQVSLVQDDNSGAESYLRRLLALPEQDLPRHRVLLAAALIGQARFGDALEPLQSAIAEACADGSAPPEQWLSMLASVHYEREDYPAMRNTMARLATLYPREQYLLNLAALHGQLGDSGRQLALVEALRDDERLSKETRLVMLANLFLAEGLPWEAARLLETAIDDGRVAADRRNLETLSQAWYLAAETERAIEPLAAAAALAEDGELYLRLARLHMDANAWAAAEEAAGLAIERGGLREEGQAWLVRGMAAARREQFRSARDYFTEAAQHTDAARYAAQWLTWIDSEAEAARQRQQLGS